jgi:prepilin-type N-terminal cleavage/methylation domain-containing protein
MKGHQYRSGFTIVELLIVIVVVGILAAITIVAYNGIQDRARLAAGMAFEHQLRSKYGTDTMGDWSFDECSGTSVKNNGSPQNTDTVLGSVSWITDTPTGKGCALRFNGSTTQIQTNATLGSTYYVKAAWVRITAASCGSYNIISQGSSSGVQAAFYTPSCQLNAGHNGAWGTAASTQAINDGKWHYVAAIWESGNLQLFLDGKSVTNMVAAAVPNTITGYVAIGSHGGGSFMNGDIDNPFVAAQ